MQDENIPKTYTPAEFAALFGKHKTWGYRRIYAGAVQILKHSPRHLIPQAEVDKFSSTTVVHQKSRKTRGQSKGAK